jgi:hypothetical protein
MARVKCDLVTDELGFVRIMPWGDGGEGWVNVYHVFIRETGYCPGTIPVEELPSSVRRGDRPAARVLNPETLAILRKNRRPDLDNWVEIDRDGNVIFDARGSDGAV